MTNNNNIQDNLSEAPILPENKQINHDDDTLLPFDYKRQEKSIIKVVGVGGGGGNAVKHMYTEGIQDVSFLLINTDRTALEGSSVPDRLQIGPGLGAGAKPEVAKQYALESVDDIRAALDDGTEMVFITAGMGGGTGTGAAPIVAQVAKEMGILTVAIVTIPFKFEGPRKINMALKGVEEIRQFVDALLIVNNDRLINIYPDLTFFNAFSKADDTLSIAARSISEIVTKEGYINLDFADVDTTLRNSGVAIISTGHGEGEKRLTQAIKDAISSPLLLGKDIHTAQHLLFNICFSSQSPATMQEMSELNDFVSQFENEGIEVIWGAQVDDGLGEKIKMIILASGFDMNDISTPSAPEVTKEPIPTPELSPNIDPCPTQGSTPINHTVSPKPQPEENISPNKEEVIQQQPEIVEEEESIQTANNLEHIDVTTPNVPAQQEPEIIETAFEQKNENADVEQAHTEQDTSEGLEQNLNNEKIEDAPIINNPIQEVKQQTHTETEAQDEQTVSVSAPTTPAIQEIQKPVTTTTTSTSYPKPKVAKTIDEGIENIGRYYGEEVAAGFASQVARAAYYTLDDSDLDNETLIERLEQLPAYNRRRSDLTSLKQINYEDPNSLAGPDGTIQFNH